MKVALLHDHYDTTKLDAVIADMKVMGIPTIKAVWSEAYDMWVALEGCHRLRAAQSLGITPDIEEVEYSDEVITMDSGDDYTISEIVDDAYRSRVLSFED